MKLQIFCLCFVFIKYGTYGLPVELGTFTRIVTTNNIGYRAGINAARDHLILPETKPGDLNNALIPDLQPPADGLEETQNSRTDSSNAHQTADGLYTEDAPGQNLILPNANVGIGGNTQNLISPVYATDVKSDGDPISILGGDQKLSPIGEAKIILGGEQKLASTDEEINNNADESIAQSVGETIGNVGQQEATLVSNSINNIGLADINAPSAGNSIINNIEQPVNSLDASNIGLVDVNTPTAGKSIINNVVQPVNSLGTSISNSGVDAIAPSVGQSVSDIVNQQAPSLFNAISNTGQQAPAIINSISSTGDIGNVPSIYNPISRTRDQQAPFLDKSIGNIEGQQAQDVGKSISNIGDNANAQSIGNSISNIGNQQPSSVDNAIDTIGGQQPQSIDNFIGTIGDHHIQSVVNPISNMGENVNPQSIGNPISNIWNQQPQSIGNALNTIGEQQPLGQYVSSITNLAQQAPPVGSSVINNGWDTLEPPVVGSNTNIDNSIRNPADSVPGTSILDDKPSIGNEEPLTEVNQLSTNELDNTVLKQNELAPVNSNTNAGMKPDIENGNMDDRQIQNVGRVNSPNGIDEGSNGINLKGTINGGLLAAPIKDEFAAIGGGETTIKDEDSVDLSDKSEPLIDINDGNSNVELEGIENNRDTGLPTDIAYNNENGNTVADKFENDHKWWGEDDYSYKDDTDNDNDEIDDVNDDDDIDDDDIDDVNDDDDIDDVNADDDIDDVNDDDDIDDGNDDDEDNYDSWWGKDGPHNDDNVDFDDDDEDYDDDDKDDDGVYDDDDGDQNPSNDEELSKVNANVEPVTGNDNGDVDTDADIAPNEPSTVNGDISNVNDGINGGRSDANLDDHVTHSDNEIGVGVNEITDPKEVKDYNADHGVSSKVNDIETPNRVDDIDSHDDVLADESDANDPNITNDRSNFTDNENDINQTELGDYDSSDNTIDDDDNNDPTEADNYDTDDDFADDENDIKEPIDHIDEFDGEDDDDVDNTAALSDEELIYEGHIDSDVDDNDDMVNGDGNVDDDAYDDDTMDTPGAYDDLDSDDDAIVELWGAGKGSKPELDDWDDFEDSQLSKMATDEPEASRYSLVMFTAVAVLVILFLVFINKTRVSRYIANRKARRSHVWDEEKTLLKNEYK